jgi:hypothetical protein
MIPNFIFIGSAHVEGLRELQRLRQVVAKDDVKDFSGF